MNHIVHHSASLHDAFSTGISHAHTVVDGKQVVGMVLMRDLIAAAASGNDPKHITVADVMNKAPISIVETPNTLAMARKFVQHRIKSLVVTDDAGDYIRDLAPPEAITMLPSGLMGFFQPAERCMIRDPYDITADHNMQEALNRLAEYKVSCLLVHDFRGESVGMISESDVTRWIIEGKKKYVRVSDCMSSPVVCMPDQSNLMQVWNEMSAMKVLKMVMVNYNGAVSGLITATDVLCALSQSMLDNFSRYHCPDNADMMLEWHKGGMIMAVSDAMTKALDCDPEHLVGLTWGADVDEAVANHMLGLGAQSEIEIKWKALTFKVKRDGEQAMMWWSLI
ncbi:MAG: CBS domain-containing protein [Mariprofundaceae bacterium]|nr:CBS domain-containing protein [Mariprofundaceae bacterium]